MTFRFPRVATSQHRYHHGGMHHQAEHHGHHHSHHSHGRSHSRSGIGFAVAACLLVGWAVIPLASVGFFENRLLAMGTWTLVGLFCLIARQQTPPSNSLAWTVVAAGLLLWCTIQLIPLPAAHFHFWRGDAGVFAQIATHAGGRLCMAIVPYLSFHTMLYWSGLFALGCMTARCLRSRASIRWLFVGFILLAVTECAYGLFLRNSESLRIRSTFANADAFGSLLAMTLPLTACLLMDRLPSSNTSFRHLPLKKMGWALALAAVFLFQLVILFFTGSRGATGSAFLVLALLLVWCGHEFRSGRKALLGGLLLLAVLAPLFFLHAQRENVWDRAFNDEFEWQSGIEGRKDIWKAGFDLVRAFPFGTGPDGTAFAMPMYQKAVHGRYRLDYAHNDTLQFLGDLGWPGGALLLLGLLLLARQAIRTCRNSEKTSSPPWLQRGCTLALLAALIHSQVEFNLSARPPLQLMFVLLSGALFSHTGESSVHHHKHSSHEAASSFSTWLCRATVACAAAIAVFFSYRAAVAYREARSAARAMDIATPATDSLLLLPAARTLPIPLDDACLARAARWGARSPFVQSVLASIPLSNHRHAVHQTALLQAKALSRSGEADTETDATTPLPEPEVTPVLMAQATAALRLEEAESVRAARPFADAALRLAPWDAQSMTDRAWLVLRGIALRTAPASEAADAHADLDLAAALYPTDAYTLSAICAALTAEEKPAENLAQIMALAERAFTLNPSDALMLMDRWWRAGIPLADLARIPDLPVPVLQNLYRRAMDISDTSDLADADAEFILSCIEDRTKSDSPPPAISASWPPKRLHAWERQRDRQRLWAVKERLLRNLRSGDWTAITASSPVRAEARELRSRLNLDPLASSPVIRRLRLREWNSRNTLPRYGRVEWALSECVAGTPPEQFRDVWEEAVRHRPLPPEQANRLPASVVSAYPALLESPPPATEESNLALSYLGERLFLEDVFIEPDGSAPGGASILLDWRFASPLFPPNLRLLVRLRDEVGRLLLNKSVPFETAMPTYRRGNPPPDSRFRTTTPLPLLVSYARTLEILLLDGKTALPQDDLQSTLRIPYSAIPVRSVP